MRCLSFLFDSKRRGRDPELIYNRKQLKALILPLMFEQFLNVMVGMVDTLMVSKAGEAAVSGVALTTNINLLIIQVMAALATGGAVVCSQYNGRKDTEEATFAAAQLETRASCVFGGGCVDLCRIWTPDVAGNFWKSRRDGNAQRMDLYVCYGVILSVPWCV